MCFAERKGFINERENNLVYLPAVDRVTLAWTAAGQAAAAAAVVEQSLDSFEIATSARLFPSATSAAFAAYARGEVSLKAIGSDAGADAVVGAVVIGLHGPADDGKRKSAGIILLRSDLGIHWVRLKRPCSKGYKQGLMRT